MIEVILVNEQDEEVGAEEKILAHQKGLLHRAFSVFVFRKQNGATELLLQRRQQDKYHAGGLWTNTCCSHPRPGETSIDAAHRRLQEEMGIDVDLEEVGVFQYRSEFDNGIIEHEVDHVFVGWFCNNTISFDPNEISEIQWVNVLDLACDLDQHEDQYTPWFRQAFLIALER